MQSSVHYQYCGTEFHKLVVFWKEITYLKWQEPSIPFCLLQPGQHKFTKTRFLVAHETLGALLYNDYILQFCWSDGSKSVQIPFRVTTAEENTPVLYPTTAHFPLWIFKIHLHRLFTLSEPFLGFLILFITSNSVSLLSRTTKPSAPDSIGWMSEPFLLVSFHLCHASQEPFLLLARTCLEHPWKCSREVLYIAHDFLHFPAACNLPPILTPMICVVCHAGY